MDNHPIGERLATWNGIKKSDVNPLIWMCPVWDFDTSRTEMAVKHLQQHLTRDRHVKFVA